MRSKSHNNAIALAATPDETARLLRRAKTDSDPVITYDPVDRPEVANLLLLTGLCEDLDPAELAEQIGSRGAAELKRRAIEAINERLRPIRDRRAALMGDRGYLRAVLHEGSAAARAIAQDTLRHVSAAMHTDY
jgi:tryptophanyl-tRNA synthetase